MIDQATIDTIAERAAQFLREPNPGTRLVDAEDLARRHGVSRSFIYEHAEELGVIRLGAGPRPRLRFDPELALRAFADRRQDKNPGEEAGRRRARGRHAGPVAIHAAPLLPIRGAISVGERA